ncbi:DNA-processing protein DprA [Paeniglutamicibacter cryotolerans]|uniref:DNA processing protein n=1 Tax=Paeniglutamicibacter cryotolerans TaxID=670079 RepID=A0A839QM92_9MICC|nr:DNA-processing protein DprA [Paeniglutamicibacter cryotolerans]MBB2997359.1 DNA processing protein [Paeniglutamicibacter cryotolerans]
MTKTKPAFKPTQIARAGLSKIIEPNDPTGSALVAIAGPIEAYRIITTYTGTTPPTEQQQVSEFLDDTETPRADRKLDAGLERWKARAALADPAHDLDTMALLGGGMLTPEDEEWPEQFDALGPAAPLALWWRGNGNVGILSHPERLLAVVGSRDATEYGRQVTSDIVSGVVGRGITVLSGGAYGIDACAHAAALDAGRLGVEDGVPAFPPTIAVMAGGLDRYYPEGNTELLRSIQRAALIIAEVAPGTTPTRWRFLARNRVIAALCAGTLVTEARWRSGALSTARHAAGIGRELGAVPGSIYSANSAGCHRLLREAAAIPVTDAAEALELIKVSAPATSGGTADEDIRDYDGLNVQDLLLLDALPNNRPRSPDELAATAGLGIGAVLGGLSRLAGRGLARSTGEAWSRAYPG